MARARNQPEFDTPSLSAEELNALVLEPETLAPIEPASAPFTVRRLLDLLGLPMLLGCLVCVAGTLVVDVMPEGHRIQQLAERLDLRAEGTAATWFESVLFLLCGLSCALLTTARTGPASHKLSRLVYGAGALGCVFLGLDEATSIHEWLGTKASAATEIADARPEFGGAFFWIVLYAPPLILALMTLFLVTSRLIVTLPDPRTRRQVIGMLFACGFLVPLFVGSEVAEGRLWSQHLSTHALTGFEEILELVILTTVLHANRLMARGLGL